MVDQYIFSGSLPENASTYVKREADDELNEALLQGKFCYVLNSRQSGKSSLRVRTMSRLSEAGVECASIDLSSINIQTATQENWYADLIVKLIDSFALDVDFKGWWEQNQLNSPLLRFSNFLTKILLAEISENIVIFIDEIDSVLSLNFPTDDFFAFIRSCYNERVDNSQYNRLTFCLLGVASPTSLIQDKNRTPFNIGKAISLKGFQLHEAEPLEKGLRGNFSNPQVVMQEILHWTGGQPFLTQKLCQFMVEESEQDNPCSVEQVVRLRIIENWESQDEPEHLRTIQARILRDEQRAGYLLELYQQVRLSEEQSEVTADETLEQSELQLSGLVVKEQGKLRIYNQIYREIFDFNWIENQLNNLRPYSENFRFWVASVGADDSRLLRGKALQSAEEWARDKNLSYQDKQYLAASKEKEIQEEIAVKEQEAALERERKDREAAEGRNQLLSEANKKAQRQISVGVVVLVVAVLGAVTLGIWSRNEVEAANSQVNEAKKNITQAQEKATEAEELEQQAKEGEKLAQKKAIEANKTARKAQQQAKKAEESTARARQNLNTAQSNLEAKSRELSKTNVQLSQAQKKESAILAKLTTKENELNQTNAKNEEAKAEIVNVRQLVALAGQLRNQSSSNSDEALRLAAVSFNIDNHKLKQSLLLAAKSQAYQEMEDWSNANKEIQESQSNLSKADQKFLDSSQGLQVQVLVQKSQGDLLAQNKKTQKAIESYTAAFNILKTHLKETDFTKDNQLLTGENIESLHQILIELNPQDKQVEASLIKHLYTQLEYFLKAKNWGAADRETEKLMLNIAKAEEQKYLDIDSINNFSCDDLQEIDQLWFNADNRFGFRVQKEIWISTGNRLGRKLQDWTDKDSENYLRFAKAVGWYDDKLTGDNQAGNSRGSFVDYDELMRHIKENSVVYGGSLPVGWLRKNTGKGNITINQGSLILGKEEIFFSRVATCKL
ncbi:AAA-like domain-containing protein [Nostoc sp. LEGE 12450]|uniref:AAA-like domain-containing protein n=1 Tax=Nostoc sp. LEGE 12450 TaxID=1828643 RepID=UPI0018826FD6|nr:AAA-like domain-containing protein [Nostoc sp. LEGE 12450]MBE8992536.1 AAA-like domain-containing protein [Nostoc sp. LEGE 12450]